MITIPFYYHDGFSTTYTFGEIFGALLGPKIRIEALPCLCSSALGPIKSPLALYHGERGENPACYLAAKKVIFQNPQTTFYVVRINATSYDTGSDCLLADASAPKNCKEVNAGNLSKMVDEIGESLKIKLSLERGI